MGCATSHALWYECVCVWGGGGGEGLSAGRDMACALVLVLGHSMSCVSRAWRNEEGVAYM